MSTSVADAFRDLPDFMTVGQCSAFLGVSCDTVIRYYRDGLLKGYRTSGQSGRYMINKDSVAELANIDIT